MAVDEGGSAAAVEAGMLAVTASAEAEDGGESRIWCSIFEVVHRLRRRRLVGRVVVREGEVD